MAEMLPLSLVCRMQQPMKVELFEVAMAIKQNVEHLNRVSLRGCISLRCSTT